MGIKGTLGGPKTPGSGRKKGSVNKSTEDIMQKLARLGCDPMEGMAIIALNRLPCGVCRGKGKTPYKLPDGGIGTRTCESCYGTLYENCSPELRGKMNAEIAQYIAPKRKALEISGNLGFNLGERLVNGRKRAFADDRN